MQALRGDSLISDLDLSAVATSKGHEPVDRLFAIVDAILSSIVLKAGLS